MHNYPKTRKWIQVARVFAVAGALVRLGFIFRQREKPLPVPKKVETPLAPEQYVSPKKLYAYDLKSARQITRQPAWVREGYKHVYYPFNPARHRTDFRQESGRLGPIERLEIKDVLLDTSPGSPDQHQVMAAFEKAGRWYAFPIGAERAGQYQIYIDEILYIQDPRELYDFWPPDVWLAIDRHEVKPGMNELQASFAVGVGLIESSAASEDRVLRYPNDGHPLIVTYRGGKAVKVRDANARPIPEHQA